MAEESVSKSQAAPTTQQAVKKLELIRPKDGLACYYANHFQLGQSSSDVRVVFGEITNVDDKSIEVTQRGQLTMSWLQAKVLAEFLTTHVRLFEERNGPIQTEFAPLVNATPPNFPRIVERSEAKS
jgi:hypothetical protein